MKQQDYKLYRALTEPKTRERADADANAFFGAVEALRAAHGLLDVHIIIGQNIVTDEGEELPVMTTGHIGDESQADLMCAFAYGRATTIAAMRRDKIKAHGMKVGRKGTP